MIVSLPPNLDNMHDSMICSLCLFFLLLLGWASKVCADHLGYGVKSGAPYIRHNKASNPFTNLRKEYKGLWWQEDMIRFLSTVTLDPAVSNAEDCYVQLSHLIEARFAAVHAYFGRLANAM